MTVKEAKTELYFGVKIKYSDRNVINLTKTMFLDLIKGLPDDAVLDAHVSGNYLHVKCKEDL